MTNTPSKAEIEALVKRHGATSYRNRADTQHPAYGFTEDGLNGLIDEVLAKWGQPATGGEPVANVEVRSSKNGTTLTWSPDFGAFSLPEGLHKLYLAYQPVVREPLTDAQIAEMMRDTWGCASIAPRHALEFARAVERAHGITQKGGQHG